jgi:hypothetical protein
MEDQSYDVEMLVRGGNPDLPGGVVPAGARRVAGGVHHVVLRFVVVLRFRVFSGTKVLSAADSAPTVAASS